MVSVTSHIEKLTAKRRSRGLTLIELVLVVAVLAILAGFIVPRLGFIRNLAADSGNATTVADGVQQSVLYNTAIGHYPRGEDTLLNAAGTGLDASLNASLLSALTTTTLEATAYKSLTGQFATNTVVLYNQADVNTATPNSDDTTPNTLSSTSVLAIINTANTFGEAIYRAGYPSTELTLGVSGTVDIGTPNDGTYLVAIGYGTNSEINGKTGLEAPVLFDKNPGEYTRPIFLLKVFPGGSTATGVPAGSNATTSTGLSFDGTTVGGNLAKYSVDQNR